MLFAHFGVTGPLVLSASANMQEGNITEYKLFIDLKPALSFEELDRRLIGDFTKYAQRDFCNALDDLLPQVDLLIMALPGTPETRHIMDARRLHLLPEDAFIVNVGRGSAIDEAALASQLRAGRFAGVALDVFQTEPLPSDDPLWDCPRLLITPHVAGNMTLGYTRQRIVELFVEDFGNYCEGKPLKRGVTLGQGY
jgi:phosphoglycerate dehydrogenase-like enzyme